MCQICAISLQIFQEKLVKKKPVFRVKSVFIVLNVFSHIKIHHFSDIKILKKENTKTMF